MYDILDLLSRKVRGESVVGSQATLLYRSLTDVLASHTYATPIASHTHSTTRMYLSCVSESTPSQTLLQHPAAEFRRAKKVAWCGCDNSPPPSSPVVPLWRGMEKGFTELWRDLIRRRATQIPSSRRKNFVAGVLGKSKEDRHHELP